MDRTTLLLSAARFASAIARLCLGPLMPLLTVALKFSNHDKPALLSAYSSGYILTQIGGGFLADRYGASAVIATAVGTSSLILLYITSSTSAAMWTQAFFCLGLVAGPLFPAGSTAISTNIPPERRAAAAAIVDAAAAAGTTVAALAPMIADQFGWKCVYYMTSVALAAVAVGALSLSDKPKPKSSVNSSNSSSNRVEPYPISALISPVALATYLCHSVDNFTKYSINAWAATMLSERHGASPNVIGAILGTQEAIGVVSRLLVGILLTSGSASSLAQRGMTSAIAFAVQGIALLAAFSAPTPTMAAIMFVLSAIAVGAHSVGFRPMYFEASPEHAGAISGMGNTVASLASAIGPVLVGSVSGWDRVGLIMVLVNITGVLASMAIATFGATSLRTTKNFEE
jgi:MFS family permease